MAKNGLAKIGLAKVGLNQRKQGNTNRVAGLVAFRQQLFFNVKSFFDTLGVEAPEKTSHQNWA